MLLYFLIGFIFITTVGALMHFVYDWLNHNKFISVFVAVNESTWEHLKLGLTPLFVWAFVGMFFNFNNFSLAVLVAILTFVIVLPSIFYGYTHFTKKPNLTVDITSFYITIALAMFFAYLVMSSNQFAQVWQVVGTVGVISFVICLLLFTFYPPHMFLFLDPITKKYGHAGHCSDGHDKKK